MRFTDTLDDHELHRLRHLLDVSAAERCVDAYFRALDERRFDVEHLATIIAPDGVIVRPNDTRMTGPDEIAASHGPSFARFE